MKYYTNWCIQNPRTLFAIAPKERPTSGKPTCNLFQTKAMHDEEPGADHVERGQAVQTEREVAPVMVP
jgi:hypothetical protein